MKNIFIGCESQLLLPMEARFAILELPQHYDFMCLHAFKRIIVHIDLIVTK